MLLAMIHRYHLPHYQAVAVYFWPILFIELWRVDRWCAETGRWAIVEIDRYGRAWVPYWEGMTRNYHLHGIDARAYSAQDVAALCPGRLSRSLMANAAIARIFGMTARNCFDCDVDPGNAIADTRAWPLVPLDPG